VEFLLLLLFLLFSLKSQIPTPSLKPRDPFLQTYVRILPLLNIWSPRPKIQ
jgi:hypothetical protein